MPFRDIIAQHEGHLTPADKQITQTLLANPTKSALMSAAEIAEQVGVHESTVTRLAQKLGYRGYRALRADLLREHTPASRMQRRLDEAPGFATLVNQEIVALHELVHTINQQQLDQAAQTLIAAQRIFLFGQGHATSLLEFMDRRLRRSGFNTVVLKTIGRDMAERLLTLNQQDVILAFAFYMEPPNLHSLLNLAQERQIPTILISDALGPLIRPKPTILLAARRGAEDQFLTLTIPLVICNGLILTIAKLDERRSLDTLEQLSDLMRRFQVDVP